MSTLNRVKSRMINLLFISVLFQSEKDTEDQCDIDVDLDLQTTASLFADDTSV